MRRLVKIELVDEFPLYDIEVENDHCFELENSVVAHNSIYAKTVVSGGTKIYLAADDIWIITRSQEKEGTQVAGYTFNINIEKSRTVFEKSRIPITVMYDGGIKNHTGLLDLALEMKFAAMPTNGWYSKVDPDTGEIEDKKYRRREIDEQGLEWFQYLLTSETFKRQIRDKFQYVSDTQDAEDEYEVELDD